MYRKGDELVFKPNHRESLDFLDKRDIVIIVEVVPDESLVIKFYDQEKNRISIEEAYNNFDMYESKGHTDDLEEEADE